MYNVIIILYTYSRFKRNIYSFLLLNFSCKKCRVKQNYHSICTECAKAKKKCAKCLETYDGDLYIVNEMEHMYQDVESMKSEMRRLVTNEAKTKIS